MLSNVFSLAGDDILRGVEFSLQILVKGLQRAEGKRAHKVKSEL